MLGAVMLQTDFAAAQNNGYLITGEAQGLDGMKAYMYNMESDVVFDSTVITGGKFRFVGHTDTAMLVTVFTEEMSLRKVVLIRPATQLLFNVASSMVKGDKPSEQYDLWTKGLDALEEERHRLGDLAVAMQSDSVLTLYYGSTQRIKDYADSIGWTLYKANADNKIGGLILYDMVGVLTMNIDLYNEEPAPAILRLLSTYDSALPVVKNSHALSQIIQKVSAQILLKRGSQFRDFEAIDYATGEQTTLGAVIKGHVAVVDFWASWCGPCRREIEQTLKPLHKKYADRGLVVIGIDVWDEAAKHDKAVKDLGIDYPQLVDTDRNNSAMLYGIQSIPQIFLIDRDGTVIGNYRSGALVEAVEKALGVER